MAVLIDERRTTYEVLLCFHQPTLPGGSRTRAQWLDQQRQDWSTSCYSGGSNFEPPRPKLLGRTSSKSGLQIKPPTLRRHFDPHLTILAAMDPTLLIGDIVERDSDKKPPTDFSDVPVASTGFPQHKRRWKSLAFKQRRGNDASHEALRQDPQSSSKEESSPRGSGDASQASFEDFERKRIDQENRQKIEGMTPDEIAQAQREIMNGMNPGLVQRLLKRSTIDEQPDSSFERRNTDYPREPPSVPEIKDDDTPKLTKVQFADEPTVVEAPTSKAKKIPDGYDEDAEPSQMPPDLFPITDPPKSTHFPTPPKLPDLDPSDPNFLQTLQEKYFPDLPADPSKMAWMAPVPTKDSVADKESPYYPHPEIAVSALRFDFRGRFLSPRVSRSIPASKGLHNHGEAPEAAGYTVAELARLARSAVPAQRCIAFQTLGRILYRLGIGEWGKTENDPIAMGVWNAIKQGRVLDTLNEAAAYEGGHRGSQAYATEALWLFEKGGWKERLKGR